AGSVVRPFPKQEFCPPLRRYGPTAGQSGAVVTLPAGRGTISALSLDSWQHWLRLRSFIQPGRRASMQLKHLNLTTSDVTGLATFFERFFGFKRLLERGSGAFTILSNNEDFVLT